MLLAFPHVELDAEFTTNRPAGRLSVKEKLSFSPNSDVFVTVKVRVEIFPSIMAVGLND